eukprot:8017251-Pyramimonas_sp.AAC.1
MREGLRRSVEDDSALQTRRQQSLSRVAPRLAQLGLQRAPTEPYGNCQFIAVCQAANLAEWHLH